MQIAVLADIHGNLEAFQTVLEDLDKQAVDVVYCLGDFIDYGADSEVVAKEIIRRKIPTVIGNHEYALLDSRILGALNEIAYESLMITKNLISEVTLDFIRTLPIYLVAENIRFVHGVPPDSFEDYIVYYPDRYLNYIFQSFPEQIAFIGHTHTLGLYTYNGNYVVIESLHEGEYCLDPKKRYIINIGSVGQPRDKNKQAKYVIYNNQTKILTVRFLTYDAKKAAIKIIRAGLPEYNAMRLL
jgi:predicted phosphodiesterase